MYNTPLVRFHSRRPGIHLTVVMLLIQVLLSGCERSSNATASRAQTSKPGLHAATQPLEISEPVAGTVLKHGDVVRVVVNTPRQFTPRDGVVINIGVNSHTVHSPPFVANLTVPNNLLGETSIAAVAVDRNGAVAAAEQKVKIIAAEPLQGMAFSKGTMRMFPKKMAREYLPLKGIYANGVRGPVSTDIVTYRVDDPSIATVDDQGFVIAGRFGRTRIHAIAGEFTASIEVVVEDSE